MNPKQLKQKLKEFTDEIEREKYFGDFLATWSRRQWDEPLEGAFRASWVDLGFESRTFKAMRPDLPQTRLPNSEERYEWKDFFRSDHASFWFPPLTSNTVRRAPNRTSTASHTSLNAILLTDLGPWRKSYAKCYHANCDDDHFLTDGNLAFMQQVVDSLVLTLLRLGHGRCSPVQPSAGLTVTTGMPTPSPAPVSTEPTTSTTTTTTKSPASIDSTSSTTSTVAPPGAIDQILPEAAGSTTARAPIATT